MKGDVNERLRAVTSCVGLSACLRNQLPFRCCSFTLCFTLHSFVCFQYLRFDSLRVFSYLRFDNSKVKWDRARLELCHYWKLSSKEMNGKRSTFSDRVAPPQKP